MIGGDEPREKKSCAQGPAGRPPSHVFIFFATICLFLPYFSFPFFPF